MSLVTKPIITDETGLAIAQAIRESGGGGGGVSSYAELPDKPSINSVTLSGNKTLADLGIASASDLSALSDIVGQANELLEGV